MATGMISLNISSCYGMSSLHARFAFVVAAIVDMALTAMALLNCALFHHNL
eukprot:SAG31_NODE_1775_length_7303_cov_2.409356_4_plen_51_part_00